jgi:hypothetical protein
MPQNFTHTTSIGGTVEEAFSMCDYSLEHLASRPAKVGDKLVTTKFKHSLTGGFCGLGEPNVAVCLAPGTELAFERDIETLSGFWMRPRRLDAKLARFRRVHEDQPGMHHDALELPSGQIALVTLLREGQFATVIQLPATERQHPAAEKTPATVAV